MSSSTVVANLNYFSPPANGDKPYVSINADSTGVRPQNWVREPHDIEIENVRGKEGEFSLDTSGFQYFRHPQKYTSFSSDEEIAREYYPESIELVKKLTGASRIQPFDHSKHFALTRILRSRTDHKYDSFRSCSSPPSWTDRRRTR